VWIDLPGFIAAAYAHMGNSERARHYLNLFIDSFRSKITPDHDPTAREIIDWMTLANPFQLPENRRLMIDGLILAGLEGDGQKTGGDGASLPGRLPMQAESGNRFEPDTGFWTASFDGVSARIAEVKGFYDLARLMVEPGRQIHCVDLMGGHADVREGDTPFDERARRDYEQRIQTLQEEIESAETMNDLLRAEQLNAELDQLTDHLSRALGLGGRLRKTSRPVERARAAVTWRIRSAIRKIEAAHPALGRHLTNTVRTGTFCSYEPEKKIVWLTS
jgi:hypothetical protein